MIKRVVVCVILAVILPFTLIAASSSGASALDSSSTGNREVLTDMLAGFLWNSDNQEKRMAELSEADVKKIQTLLEGQGYSCGGVDGIVGPNTENAIAAFLKDTGSAQASVTPVKVFSRAEIRINIPEYTLSLIEKGKVTRQFDIAVGTPYEQTPTGSFGIFAKIEYPTWFPGSGFSDKTPVPPGPDNPLGTRWMEFVPNYGIHGTNKDWDIRYPVSGGCIRMHDVEARELYKIVDIGTPVVIVYETMKVVEKQDGLYLKVYPDIYRKNTSTLELLRQMYEPYITAGYKLIASNAVIPKDIDEVFETKIADKPNLISASQESGTLKKH